ncbi:MAG TPA: ADOP family duplicated permease [Longimicrobiales bacterium]
MMGVIRDLIERLRYAFRGTREADELREEMAFHREQDIAEAMRNGMSREDAERAASQRFGSADVHAEATRDASGIAMLLDFVQDLKLAARGLRRTPGFAAVSIFTLAVGIGVATLVFSIVDHVAYRPLPGIATQKDLVIVRVGAEDAWNDALISKPDFQDMAAGTPALSSMTTYQWTSLHAALGRGNAQPLNGHAVVGDYFGTLGTTPQRGRFFTHAELSGAAPTNVAVISDALWREQFQSQPVLGATIRLNANPFTIIGITPRGFGGPERSRPADVWVPGAVYGSLRHMRAERRSFDSRDAGFFGKTVARLAPTGTVAQAREQLQTVVDHLVEQFPESAEQYSLGPVEVHQGIGISPGSRDTMARTVRLLLMIGGFVLVVACANVANLLLFRAVNTRGESAIRRALGATGARVLQHHAAQGIVIALLSAIVGIALSLTIGLLLRDTGLPIVGPLEGIRTDRRVLLFAAVLGLLTSTLFAALPTMLARTTRLTDLYGGARSETGRMIWLRRTLVVTQVALASALVIPGILLATTVRNLSDVELGFDPDRLMMFGIATEQQGYDEAAVIRLRARVLDEVARTPGIESVALANAELLSGGGFFDRYQGPVQGIGFAYMNTVGVSRNYFETVGIPIINGRSFNASEDNNPEAPGGGVVLNRKAAQMLFGSANAVGRSLKVRNAEEVHVIGVVEDSHSFGLRADPRPAVYRPVSLNSWIGTFFIMVRSNVSADRTERLTGDVVSAIDPNIPFFRTRTLSDTVDDAMLQERLFARLATILAGLAAVLSGIGLYGLMAYAVARRRREIGIRMALGARRSGIIADVTSESLIFALVGSIIGWFGGASLVRFIRSMLFGVTALDSRLYLATALIFITIALISALVPARTAATTHPATVLKTE